MKPFLLLLFSICFIIQTKAQDLGQTYTFASELQARQDYHQALLTYHRVLFFDQKGQYRGKAYQQMGTCYYALQDFENAAVYYDLAYFTEKNDSVKLEMLFQKTSSLLLNQNFEYALVELLNLPDSLSPYFAEKNSFYSAITYFGLKDFKQSELFFTEVIGKEHPKEQKAIEEAFQQIKKIEKISPKKAKLLSSILPGLGQIYAGDWKNGINSLALTTGFVFLAYHSALTYSFLDAIASVAPWYQRYYMGGYMRAEQIAIDKKNRERAKVYEKIMTQVAQTR